MPHHILKNLDSCEVGKLALGLTRPIHAGYLFTAYITWIVQISNIHVRGVSTYRVSL